MIKYNIAFFFFLFFIGPATSANCIKPSETNFDKDKYYSGTRNLSGDELRKKLNQLIKGHEVYSYSCVWEILKDSDEDINNSDNIIGLYTGRSIPKKDKDQGQNDPDSWNREHVWAKSHGFPKKNQHAYTDTHHIRAADRSVNSDRSNYDFANGGKPHQECEGCKQGDKTWEAPDHVKGDIARMMFYMHVRYQGSDDSNVSDLQLVNELTDNGDNKFGKLCTLLEWHNLDPVDQKERDRHNVVFQWQKNRNPFIDHPEFALKIWGKDCSFSNISDSEIKQKIIERSIDNYSGNCPCPYNTTRSGRKCGKRSAYSRPGGYSPICYEHDVTQAMIEQYRKK